MKADEVNPLLPYGSGIFAIGLGKGSTHLFFQPNYIGSIDYTPLLISNSGYEKKHSGRQTISIQKRKALDVYSKTLVRTILYFILSSNLKRN